MFHFLSVVIILYFCSPLTIAQGVVCYQCAYIVGVADVNLNPDCVNNVWYSQNIFLEEGVACLKAEGIIGGQYFVIRRAVRAGIQGAVAPYLPLAAQESLGCEAFGNIGLADQSGVGNPLTSLAIGNRQVDTVTSCVLCNDVDQCNGAAIVKTQGLNITLAILFALSLLIKN